MQLSDPFKHAKGQVSISHWSCWVGIYIILISKEYYYRIAYIVLDIFPGHTHMLVYLVLDTHFKINPMYVLESEFKKKT